MNGLFYWGLFLGLFIGAFIGLFTVAILRAASGTDAWEYERRDQLEAQVAGTGAEQAAAERGNI